MEEAPLTIRSNRQVFTVKLNVDKGEVKEETQEHSNWTEVGVRLPIVDKFLDFNKIKLFLADYVLFTTHVSFKFRVSDKTMVFSQTQQNNKKWVNNSSSYYYSQTEFEHFIDNFDDDNADVYTVMQRLFREGSVMKKAGFENMNMGELKRSTKLKEELYLKMRDAIPTAPKKLSLPFDVDYKVRQDALKKRLAQRGIFVSSMKYKSKYYNYYSYDNDKIGLPFFVEVAVFHSNYIAQNLYYVNSLNNAVMPGGWPYLYGSSTDTFVWHTEAEKNNKIRYNGGVQEEACHKSRSVFEIFI